MRLFSKFDIGEVARLTKAGKLGEAMSLLQGDRVAAPRPQGAWTTPPFPPPPPAGERAFGQARLFDVAQTMEAFRKHLPDMDSLSPQRAPAALVPDGGRFEERTFSNPAGSLSYKIYVPSSYTGRPLPVVVMLHGCTQDPDDFAAGTRMNEVAEEQGLLVAYPRQPKTANMQKCWNWFNARDQQRGSGEPSLIAGVATQVVAEFSADPSRVYVAGLSAGGAAAAILAATYPDVFAAVGVHSGLACGAAHDMASAFAAMNGGGEIRPRGPGPATPTIVFHGDADRTVNLVNGDQVISQATPPAALSEVVTRGVTPDGMSYTRTVRLDARGAEALEHWVLHGAGHAWSGGDAHGSFTNARGPDASREMVRFFLQHRLA